MRLPQPLARTALGALLVACLLRPGQIRAGSAGALSLIARIEVGGEPSTIAVDHCGGRNDILFYGSGKVRFIDGNTLTLAPEEISIPTWAWEGWRRRPRLPCRWNLSGSELPRPRYIHRPPYPGWIGIFLPRTENRRRNLPQNPWREPYRIFHRLLP